MAVNLYPHQKKAIKEIKNGCILKGGVGTGKSITSLVYFIQDCGGRVRTATGGYLEMRRPRDLYIITIAKKRNNGEWLEECAAVCLSSNPETSMSGVKVTVDSWQNLHKFIGVKDAFFIFDEQKLIGSGLWVKSFLKIAKNNRWILLSATPGDTWMDYIPVFIANGFYKNRTEFIARHVIYSWKTRFPVIDRYVDVKHLISLRDSVTVNMIYHRKTTAHTKYVTCSFDKKVYSIVSTKRWHVFDDRPIKDPTDLCYCLRKVVNTDPDRIAKIKELVNKHPRVIIFYNFNYELEILKQAMDECNVAYTEYNGHKHQDPLTTEAWAYLVQYNAGAEAWNCVATDTIIFYSQNYSYRIKHQSEGRIDRLNTEYIDLYYYHLRSLSRIDLAISLAIDNKKNFNENKFMYV